MKKIYFYLSLLITPLIFGMQNVYAVGNCNATNTVDIGCLPHVQANHLTLAIVSNIAFTLIGAIFTIIVIIAGLKFITSSGKPEEIAKAKDTIIYASVGVVICILAVTIVSFVAGYI